MGRRPQNEPLTISNEEEAAQLAESRKATAENEFVLLLEDKKRILEEVEIQKSIVEDNKKVIEEGYEKINSINESILEVTSQQRKELQKFNEFKNDIDEESKKLSENIITKKKERDGILSEITNGLKIREKNVFEETQEINALKDQKKSLLDEITERTLQNKDLLKVIDKNQSTLNDILAKIDESITQRKICEGALFSLQSDVEDIKIDIKNKKVIVEQLDGTIASKKREASDWDPKIEAKRDEYNKLESQAFTILEKWEILKNKEAFIKGQYERAGIEWDQQ